MSTSVYSSLIEIMQARKSIRAYDPSFQISADEVQEMIQEAASAPSCRNLQPWRFIVIQDADVKKELKEIANNQGQVETASAVIAVIGDAEMHHKADQILSQNVAQGFITEEKKDTIVESTTSIYAETPLELRKSMATFDAGLITMQLLLIAKAKGYDTVVIGGFNSEKFAERFNLAESQFPIVLIAVGKAAAAPRGSTRLPIEDIVQFL